MVMRTILIHSDDHEFRTLIRGLISFEGISVIETDRRDELFRICRNNHFDKVITDDVRLFINDTHAVEAIRQSRSNKIYILSHSHSEHLVMSLLELGITQFLSLPIDLNRLYNKLL